MTSLADGVVAEEEFADVDPDLALLRTYEPVLRYTAGELFLPMSVEAYLASPQAEEESTLLWDTEFLGTTAIDYAGEHGVRSARASESGTGATSEGDDETPGPDPRPLA